MLLGSVATVAQPATFGALTLGATSMSGALSGSTGGNTSLPAIVSNRDRHGRNCLGYGDPNPDHTLILQKPAAKLRLAIATGGSNMTIVVAGANGVFRCGDSGILEDGDWQTGTYQVWVGTVEPNKSRNYRLTVQGNE
ncbi:hypothetical protein [Myxacorys almedinensis]|nr:hypothetical protein [Myxacorys almedinensis]